MKKMLVLFLTMFVINSSSAQSVEDMPPKSGTPEEFVVNFVKKINSSSMTFDEFKQNILSKNSLESIGEAAAKKRYEKIKAFDLNKKFEYKTGSKADYTVVKIKAGRKTGSNTSYYCNIKKLNGSFKWIDAEKD
jgi:hypothetical protein